MIFLQNLPHYSYKMLRLASVLLLSASGTAAYGADIPAPAPDYSVDGVVVDAGGTDASDARTKALAQGEAEAFKELVEKYHPPQAAELLAKTMPAQISAMIRGFEVVDEKMATNHYHATLHYIFDPRQMLPMLGQPIAAKPAVVATAEKPVTPEVKTPTAPAGPAAATPALTPEASNAIAKATVDVPPAKKVSKAVMVLPLYRVGNNFKLWSDDNKWRSVWYDAALEAGSGLVVAPLGDLDDRVDVDETNAESATSASLSRMYGRYGVSEVYVLSAFYNLKADPKPTLEVTLKRIPQDKKEIDISHLNYTIHSTETIDTLMSRAAEDIAHYIYNKQTIDPNKIEYERLKEVDARINTDDIRQWEALRKRLLTHGNIVGIRFTQISFYKTIMVITFRGTPDMLGKTLVASGLRVLEDGSTLVLSLK